MKRPYLLEVELIEVSGFVMRARGLDRAITLAFLRFPGRDPQGHFACVRRDRTTGELQVIEHDRVGEPAAERLAALTRSLFGDDGVARVTAVVDTSDVYARLALSVTVDEDTFRLELDHLMASGFEGEGADALRAWLAALEGFESGSKTAL
ncbi:MAG: hypothetical protein ACYS22_20670 [Planctomycetota bacterium]|jgi:hypothetical protein